MLFNSTSFFLFFALLYIVYLRIPSYKWQNYLLLASSIFFYAKGNSKLTLLLLGYTSFSYFISQRIHLGRSEKERKRWLILGTIGSLGVLCIFKYMNFFIENFIELSSMLGLSFSQTTLKIMLPLGISFYTFQCLGYLVDVYRKDIEPVKGFLFFTLFISFFPQLVAGPIERGSNLMPQFLKRRIIGFSDIRIGVMYAAIGYFLKCVMADTVSPLVDYSFNAAHTGMVTGMETLLGILLFGLQIYGDFAGYSFIALGVARLFGFKLMYNFRSPYFSKSPREFWHRWHVSLSTWIRDYLFISIGGSHEKNEGKNYRNLMVTMGLAGLWHGASWNYVFWGFYHGFLLSMNRLFARKEKEKASKRFSWLVPGVCTFFLVHLGWFFFRVKSYEQAKTMILNMGSLLHWTPLAGFYLINWSVFLGIVLLQHWWQEKKGDEKWVSHLGQFSYVVLLTFLVVSVYIAGLGSKEFIYFKF